MLSHDETHWWYRGRRRIVLGFAQRLALPAGCAIHARSGATGHRLGHRQRPDRGAVRAGHRGAACPAGKRRAPAMAPPDLRPRHVPRCHRAPRRRRGRPARAAAGDGPRRGAARHRSGVPAPLVAPRRGQRSPTPLRPRIAAHGAGGGRLARRRRHLLQCGAAATGGTGAGCHTAAVFPRSLGSRADPARAQPHPRSPPPTRGRAACARDAPPGRPVAAVRLPAAYSDAGCSTGRPGSGAP